MECDRMNEKKKNFFMLGLIAIITIIFVLCMNFGYSRKQNKTSFITTVISEIKENDFENYVMDNSDTIIYMAKGTDGTLRNFEKKFADLIKENELTKEIVYLNTDETSKQFYEKLKEYYNATMLENNPILSTYANVLIIKDRKIEAILYTESKIIQLDDVQNFLKENAVIQ